MPKRILWICMELLDDWGQAVHLGKIKDLVRSGWNDSIVIVAYLFRKLGFVEKRNGMTAFSQTGGKILNRDVSSAVIGECIFVDADFQFYIRRLLRQQMQMDCLFNKFLNYSIILSCHPWRKKSFRCDDNIALCAIIHSCSLMRFLQFSIGSCNCL